MIGKDSVLLTLSEVQKELCSTARCQKMVRSLYGQEHIPLAFVHSFGCQQNVSDGEKILGMLISFGYGVTFEMDKADVVIYNTCAIRENAEKKVYGLAGELSHLKKKNPSVLIGLCGCMVQQSHVAEKLKFSYPQVDFVFGTHALTSFPTLFSGVLESALSGKRKRVFEIFDSDGRIAEYAPVYRLDRAKANLPIMYGCNNFCTYCVVPLVRGRERSRRSEDVLAEAKTLVAQGYREITLLGQNVNAYGKDLKDDLSFPELLLALNGIEGDFRIRFMTSHPRDCTKELIDAIAKCDKVCNHIHLPVQSGNDRILKEMNRHYDRKTYLSLIQYAKERIKNVTFTSDIIVGFPGETEEEFLDTLSLIEEVRYLALFTFIFSPREGTKAALMEDPVSYEEKSRRFSKLLSVQKRIEEQLHREMIGKTVRVLVDGLNRDQTRLYGHSEENLTVDFPGDEKYSGNFVSGQIDSMENRALLGHSID